MRIRTPSKDITSNPRIFHETCLTSTYTALTINLFRAILRECTYLPDPNARKFFRNHVVARFRAYCPRPYKDKRQSFKKTATIIQRRPQLLNKAQRSLRYLQRANHGHPQQLIRVLAMTYGRTGPRRHELLQDLKAPDSPASTNALQNALQQRTEPANQQVPHPSQKLLALLKSQLQQKETVFMRTPVKRFEPQIPKTNAWGRPTPIKRVRNIKRRWYAETLDRIMPPLPEVEWNMLRRLTIGETPFPRPVPRRGPSGEQGVGLESYKSEGSMTRPHDINARYMRRLWAKIYQQCPNMQKDPNKSSGWRITWPELKRGTAIGLNMDAYASTGLFDGVDEGGKVRVSTIG